MDTGWEKSDEALAVAAELMPAVDGEGHNVGEDLVPLDQRQPVDTELNLPAGDVGDTTAAEDTSGGAQ